MKNCTYTIRHNDKVISLSSEKELNSFLKDNFEVISKGKNITDIEFSKAVDGNLTEQDKAVARLLEEGSKGPTIETTTLVDGTIEPKASRYKSVTKYLEELTKNGIANLVPYFSMDNYIANKANELIKDLESNNGKDLQEQYNKIKSDLTSKIIDEIEFDKRVKDLVVTSVLKDKDSWSKLASMGTNIHAVSELFFKNRLENKETTLEELNSKFHFTSSENMSNYLDYLNNLTKEIERVNGECTILPEYKFYNDKAKLVGVADFVAIDSKGKLHIYDFKTSYKDPKSWASAKVLKNSYQLGFYKNMLEAKGFNMGSLNIIPLELLDIDFENNAFSGVKNYDITDITNNITSQMRSAIDSFVPVDRSNYFKSTGKSESVKQKLHEAFGYTIEVKTAIANIEEFKKNLKPDRKNPDKLGFYDRVSGKWVSFDKSKTDEVVGEYFKKESEDSTYRLRQFKDHLSASIGGKKDLGEFDKNSEKNDAIVRVFNKYTLGDWKVVEDDGVLDELGIIALINKVTNTVDFVSYTVNNLKTKVSLTLGTSILGNYVTDAVSKYDTKIFEATNGNIELLKPFIYINDNYKSFEGLNIGDITVFNASNLTFTSNYPHRIRHNIDALFSKMKIENHIKDTPNADFYQLAISRISNLIESKDILNSGDIAKFTKFKDTLIKLQDENRLKALFDIQKELIEEFSAGGSKDVVAFNTEQQKILGIISEAIAYEKGLPLVVEQDMKKFSFNSLYLSNPNTNPSENDRFIVSEMKLAMNKIGTRQLEYKQETRKPLDELFKSKNFSIVKEYIIGANIEAYSNLFVKISNGELHPDLILKNPYDPTSTLNKEERDFLRFFLSKINKIRYGTDSAYSDIGQQKVSTGEWFQIPLLRASAASKLKNKGYKEALKEKWDSILNINNFFKQDETINDSAKDMYSMFNTFDYSSTLENREKLLQEEGTGGFETDLEAVMDMYIYSSIRKEEYDKVLPICNAIRTAMAYKAYNLGIPVENNVEFAKKYIKSAAFNDPDITPEVQKYYKFTSLFKSIVSYLNLGFSPIVGVAAFSQGQVANLVRVTSKYYGENMFDKSDYLWAEGYMMKDCTKSISSLTKVEEINMLYRLNNMDINRLPDRLAHNKKGVTNFKSNWMFWTSSAPDYFNRMCIFIAQMKKDGCWDAHEMKGGKLEYNWKKDKRFSIYALGNESSTDYNKQKALYIAMLNDFKAEGYEGTDLPRAYTLKQRESLKMISDQIHGYYDHESKILANNTVLGTLLLQFKTFMTARKEKWTMLPGEYSIGDYTQLEENGEKYWLKNGELTTENTGVPAMIFKGKFMEGIWYSLKGIAKDFHNNHYNLSSLYMSIKDHPERAANMRLLAWDTGVVLALAIAFGMIDWKELKQDDAYGYTLYRAILRSGQDLNVFNNIGAIVSGDSPFSSFSYFNDLYTSAVGVITGHKDLGKEVLRNVGTLRMFEPLISQK